METLLISVMTVSLAGGAVHLIAPEGKLRKPITFTVSLVICAVLLSPVLSLLGQEIDFSMSLPEITIPNEEDAGNTLLSLTAETICRDLEREVAYRYGIKEPRLTLTLDGSDPEAVVMVSGRLTGRGEGDMAAAYLSDLLRCPVTFEPQTKEESNGKLS